MTNYVDKIIRDTMKSLPEGQESIALLDRMRRGEKDGWTLYHSEYLKWWPNELQLVANIDECIKTLLAAPDAKYADQISLMILHDRWPDGNIDVWGNDLDTPFALGYTLKLDYDLK